jgi:hydroxymethylpyrimidine/phosphomethylpyrimidine kinase
MLAVERLGDISLVLLQALERSIRSAVRDVKLQRYVQGPARRPEVEDRVKRFWQEADGAMVGDNVMAAEDFAAEMRRRLGLG